MLHRFLLDYLLPVCVLGSLFGSLIYCYLTHTLYEIYKTHYPALVAMEPHHYRVNLDQPFQALFKVPPVLKSGEWKQIPSLWHRRLSMGTLWFSRFVLVCLFGIFVPFFI
ncbi:hypothetical protein [Andreprevotia chitinilytica]|uniref:hypothetical protein n=1 Tax=Andreprevotia chitinilytica TaxID=396808 RepID=UPI0005568E14|nr:hypothetical protein [Andreprevotia chitinilytica]